MMRHSMLSALVIGLLGCQHQTALTQIALPDATLNRTEAVFDNPTGQTRRVEYKRASDEQLVRIELQHLFSGRVVLGQVSARAESSGQWLLTDLNNNKTIASFSASSISPDLVCKTQSLLNGKLQLSADFSADGASWRAYITRIYEQPKPQAGISNESEPAIDLITCRL